MKNVLHKKGWGEETNLAHVEPPPIPLVKETSTSKLDGDQYKLKLRRYPTYSTSDLYEFRISLSEHGKPGEFLFFLEKILQERLIQNRIFNIFVRSSVGKYYVSLTYCILTCKIQKPHYMCIIYLRVQNGISSCKVTFKIEIIK